MGPHKRPGRPSVVEPNEKLRGMVQRMAERGLTQEAVAYVLGIGENTLKRRLGDSFKAGIPSADAKVQQTMFQMATSGAVPAATIFWMKARMGWREASKVEVSFDAGAMQTLVGNLIDLLKRIIPEFCPHCKTALGLKAEIAQTLIAESAKLAAPAATAAAHVAPQEPS